MARLFTLAFTLLSLFIASALAQAVCSVDKIKADFVQIGTSLANLDQDILALPDTGASLAQALKVHADFVSATNAVDVTTADLTACQSIPPSDFQALLDAFRAVVLGVEKVCHDLISKKAVFGPFPNVIALLKQDLKNLANSLVALENAIKGLAPDDLKSQVQALADEANADVAAAQAAYA